MGLLVHAIARRGVRKIVDRWSAAYTREAERLVRLTAEQLDARGQKFTPEDVALIHRNATKLANFTVDREGARRLRREFASLLQRMEIEHLPFTVKLARVPFDEVVGAMEDQAQRDLAMQRLRTEWEACRPE